MGAELTSDCIIFYFIFSCSGGGGASEWVSKKSKASQSEQKKKEKGGQATMTLPQLTSDTAFLAEEKNRYHTHCRRAKFVCEHWGKAHFGGYWGYYLLPWSVQVTVAVDLTVP